MHEVPTKARALKEKEPFTYPLGPNHHRSNQTCWVFLISFSLSKSVCVLISGLFCLCDVAECWYLGLTPTTSTNTKSSFACVVLVKRRSCSESISQEIKPLNRGGGGSPVQIWSYQEDQGETTYLVSSLSLFRDEQAKERKFLTSFKNQEDCDGCRKWEEGRWWKERKKMKMKMKSL